MLTDEGQKMPNPKIYLVEHGSCKLQRKFEYDIKNPCNHNEVIHKQTQWLTLCVVGPGSLIGDETLCYPKNEEQYEYRVIVILKHSCGIFNKVNHIIGDFEEIVGAVDKQAGVYKPAS